MIGSLRISVQCLWGILLTDTSQQQQQYVAQLNDITKIKSFKIMRGLKEYDASLRIFVQFSTGKFYGEIGSALEKFH